MPAGLPLGKQHCRAPLLPTCNNGLYVHNSSDCQSVAHNVTNATTFHATGKTLATTALESSISAASTPFFLLLIILAIVSLSACGCVCVCFLLLVLRRVVTTVINAFVLFALTQFNAC